jgi:hypothetical protein
MKDVSVLSSDPKQGHDGLWWQAPSMPAFPTKRVDVWGCALTNG